MYISSTIALSVNPTNRYYKEMGRLLQHNKNTHKNSHNKLHVVASPERAPSISEISDFTWDDTIDDDYYNIPNNNSREKEMMEEAWRDQQYHQQQQGEPSLYEPSSSYYEPIFNDFEEQPATHYANDNNNMGQLNYEMPRPPSDLPPPPPLQEPETYNQPLPSHTTTPLELNSNIPITNEQPMNELHNQHQQPKSDSTALFQAFNEHIEALGQQIQNTFKTVSQTEDVEHNPEEEWVHDGSIQSEQDSHSILPAEASTTDAFYAESIRGDFAFDDTKFESQPDETLQHQRNIPEPTIAQPQQPSAQSKQQEQELEQLERERVEKENIEAAAQAEAARKRREAEEIVKRAMQERERKKLQDEAAAEHAAKAELDEKLAAEKKDLEQELARQIAEQYRRQVESRGKEPVSIAKSKRVARLPQTNDPLELLGLDYRNPPESKEELRRTFLKMAKKYHPDSVATDASPEEREVASLNFARINSAYQLLKDKQEWLGDEYFATMLGGPMYEPRNRRSNNRQPYSRSSGFGFDDSSGSGFSDGYSSTYGARGQPRPQTGNSRTYYGK